VSNSENQTLGIMLLFMIAEERSMIIRQRKFCWKKRLHNVGAEMLMIFSMMKKPWWLYVRKMNCLFGRPNYPLFMYPNLRTLFA